MIKKLTNGELDVTVLEIKDVIDINLLQTFQDNFTIGLNIASVTVDKDGTPVTKPSSYTSFCMDLTQSTKEGRGRCALSHKKGGEEAAKTLKPYIYTCHAGLVDFAAPILIGNHLIGTILGGQVLTSAPEESKYRKVANEIGVNEEGYIDAVKKIALTTEKNVIAAAEVLYIVANSLSQVGYQKLKLSIMSQTLADNFSQISARKNMDEIQKKYTFKLEESNLKLSNEITDRLFAEDQIRHLVYYDALTELSNRKKLLEDVNILLDNRTEKFAILFMDLDKFKSANDTYGHEAGDYILKNVAVRLKSIIRSTDEVYRIGGDEFIIILRNLKDSANAEKIAVSVRETLSTAFTYKKNQLFIGASIGISIFPEHGTDVDTLIKNADLAMYEVKRNDRNGYKIYS